jgi:riboflavin kinase/FMN adenylyltransferase
MRVVIGEGTVAVVGEFDGFHRGHQSLVGEAARIADAAGAPLVAAILDRGDRPVLTPIPQRCESLLRAGAVMVLTVAEEGEPGSFGRSPMLQTELRLRRAVLASPPSSTEQLRWPALRAMLEAGGVEVTEVPRERDRRGAPVTSALVADLLGTGRVREAADLLGRDPQISGVVDLGAQRSHRLGFPTANITLGPERVWPARGVYAAWARVDGVMRAAAVNVGIRPTLHGSEGSAVIEAHLLDFAGSLYGKSIDVALVRFLRPERRFADLDLLAGQLARDVRATRACLGLVLG